MKTLLLVDDEVFIAESIRRLMRPEGYRILVAASGAEGLALLALHEVQVIVSDQRMAGMSGIEFLRQVKVRYPQTIRILLSAHADMTAIIDAIRHATIHQFLDKPWDDMQLRQYVRDAFTAHEVQAAAGASSVACVG